MDKTFDKIKAFCQDCPAWDGADCSRNPYTQGCLKDKVVCPVCGKEMEETYHGRQYCAECKEKLRKT